MRQLFDEAIGDAPPSTVDVDAAIARGRRAARIGKLGSPVVAVSAGVMLVTGGVAATLLSPAGDGPPTGAGSADATCGEARPATEQPADTINRLAGVFAPLVEARLPAGSQLEKLSGDPPENTPEPLAFRHTELVSRGEEPPGACLGGWDEFDAAADVTRNGTRGFVRVMLGRHGGFKPNRPQECAPNYRQTYCAEQTGPNGERIMLLTLQQNPEEPSVLHIVDIAKPDGTWVVVEASNTTFRGGDGPPPTAPEPPLTLAQLLEIGLDRGMTLYP